MPSSSTSKDSRPRMRGERILEHGSGWEVTFDRKSERAFARPAAPGLASPRHSVYRRKEFTMLFIVETAGRLDSRSVSSSESGSFSRTAMQRALLKSGQKSRQSFAGSTGFQADSNSSDFSRQAMSGGNRSRKSR